MDASLATHPTEAILAENLTTLRALDESAARIIESARLPAGIAPTLAHDGTPTFRIPAEHGRWRWFAGSGAPGVRAEALASAFETGTGNALLVGIGQGTLVTNVLQRLARHQALFVLETDPANLRLALTLHDWQDALRTGRLVLVPVVGTSAEEALIAALRRRPGHLAPDRILKWPWMSPRDVQSAADAARAAHDHVEAQRQADVTKCLSRLRDAAGRRRGIFVCTVSADWEPASLVGDLRHEFATLGMPCESFAACMPSRRHRAAFVHEMANFNPAGVVVVDGVRGDFAGCLPDILPVASWLIGDRRSATSTIDEQVFASEPGSVGWPPHLPLGVPRRSATPPGSEPRIVVFADGAATSASSYGIEIDSHARLWDALTAMLAIDAASSTDARIAEALRAAERKVGVRITDESIRSRFIALAERHLWPTVARDHLLARLINAGLAFELYGAGWPPGSRWRDRVIAPTPATPGELQDAAAGALLLDLNAPARLRYSQVAALAVGAVVLLPATAGRSPWDGVFARAERPPTWRNADELVALATGWPGAGRAAEWRMKAVQPRSLAAVAREFLAALPAVTAGRL